MNRADALLAESAEVLAEVELCSDVNIAIRSFLEGVPAKDDKPEKPPVDTVTLMALGNAISTFGCIVF